MSCARRMSELVLLSAQGGRRIPGKHCMSQSVSTIERTETFVTFDRTKCDCYGCSLSYPIVKHQKGKSSDGVNFRVRLYSRRHHQPKEAPEYFFSCQQKTIKNCQNSER